jgi:hypothetical protein
VRTLAPPCPAAGAVLGLSLAVATPALAAEVVAVAAVGMDPAAAPALNMVEAVSRGVAARPELRALEPARARFLFAHPAPEPRGAAQRQAQALLDQADEQLRSFQVPGAKKALAQATELLAPDLGLSPTVALDQRRLALAVAVAHAERDERALEVALDAYAARFDQAPPKAGTWPPDLVRRLASLAARPRSTLKVVTDPPGEVFVDGRKVGTSPLTLEDLPVGRHRVEAKAPDCFPLDAWVETGSAKVAELRMELPPAVVVRLARLPAEGPLPTGLRDEVAAAAARGGAAWVALVTAAKDGKASVRLVEARPGGRQHGPVLAGAPRMAFDLAWDTRDEVTAPGPARARTLTPWALSAAGAGVAAAAAGVAVRLWAKDTQDPLQTRRGALTQAEAYAIQDKAEDRAILGTVLIGAGAALVAGAAGLFTFDLVSGGGK